MRKIQMRKKYRLKKELTPINRRKIDLTGDPNPGFYK